MIITQVAVGCHRQITTLTVAEPFGEGWNIHSFFNGLSGKNPIRPFPDFAPVCVSSLASGKNIKSFLPILRSFAEEIALEYRKAV
jgi:hypothetical protein